MKLVDFLRKLHNSIVFRIFAYLSCCLIIATILINMIFFLLQERRAKAEHAYFGRNMTTLFAENVSVGVFSGSETLLRAPMKSLLHQPNILSICIYDDQFNILLSGRKEDVDNTAIAVACETMPQAGKFAGVHLEDRHSVVYQEPVYITHSKSPQEELFFNVSDNSVTRPAGFVQVRFSKRQLEAGHRSFLLQMIVITLALLAVLLPLSFVVVNQLTGPLRRLLIQVRKQMNGAPPQSSDLDILNHTFSAMLQELDQSFKTIHSYKENLEAQVEIRTEELLRINRNLSNTLEELRTTQMQLVHSEKMASLGTLSTGLAHEINNALTIIKGSARPLKIAVSELLRHNSPHTAVSGGYDDEEETIGRLLSHIDTGVCRITSLVNDLMSFARPGTGTQKLVDVNQELEIALNLVLAENRQRTGIRKSFGRLREVLSFGNQIGQVFFNILINAADSIDENGIIRISTRMSGDNQVEVTIEDNGCGIREEDMPYIFDPFFTTKEIGKGTGLGLGICRSIIQAHKGSITVQSQVTAGTTVTVTIPAFSYASTPSSGGFE